MEMFGENKCSRFSLDISPLYFHIVSKLVQELIITHDEIFQALAVERIVLLLKPFLNPTQPTYNPDSSTLACHVFDELKKNLISRRFPPDVTARDAVQKLFLNN
jgi:hypothetical protein